MIDPKKQYRTRGGREVRIYATDGCDAESIHGAVKWDEGWRCEMWDQAGKYDDGALEHMDLVEVKSPSAATKLVLRPMLPEDLKMVFDWRNSPEIRNKMFTYHEITWDEHLKWWERIQRDTSRLDLIAMKGDIPVGYMNFTEISRVHLTARWGFYKAPFAPFGSGAMMEKEALRYAFEDLKLYKLSCDVLASNERVLKMHEEFGFQKEGIFKNAHWCEGKREDIIRVALCADGWNKTRVKPRMP